MPQEEKVADALRRDEGYTLYDLVSMADNAELDRLDDETLLRTSPHILSVFLSRLDVDTQRQILRRFAPEQVSEIVSEMDSEQSAELVSEMREHRAVSVLNEMEPDDAADIVRELEDDDRDRLLKGMQKSQPEAAEDVLELLEYPEDTAGAIMNPHVATLRAALKNGTNLTNSVVAAPVAGLTASRSKKPSGALPLPVYIISSPIEPTPGSRPLQFIIKMNQKNPNNSGNAARNAFVPISGSNIPERDDITASTAICPRPGTSFAPLPNNSRTPTIITAANIHVVNMEFVTGKPNTSNNCSPLISAQNPSVANTVCIAPAIVHVFKNFKIPL